MTISTILRGTGVIITRLQFVRSQIISAAVLVASVFFMGPAQQAASGNMLALFSPNVESPTQYKSTQTIEFEGRNTSFRQVVHARIECKRTDSSLRETHTLRLEGVLRGATITGPVELVIDDSVVTSNPSGKFNTEASYLEHAVSVINDLQSWSTPNAQQRQWSQEVLLNLGVDLRDKITIVVDTVPVDIGAASDTKLVTIKTEPRILQGKSGPFYCEYHGAFVYSQIHDQLYQSTSVFTARKGSEKLRIEELTFLADDAGTQPRHRLIDLCETLGLSLRTGVFPMQGTPPSPWLLEAMAARESLYCAEKVIASQGGRGVSVTQLLTAKAAYAAVNLGTLLHAGASIATAVDAHYPTLGGWIGGYNQYTHGLRAGEQVVSSSLATNTTAVFEEYAKHIPKRPDSQPQAKKDNPEEPKPPKTPPETPRSPPPSPPPGINWGDLALYGGGGMAIAMGASGSSSSSSGGSSGGSSAPCDNGLADTYAVTASAGCVIIVVLPSSDVDISMTLNSDCTYTGAATIFGSSTVVTPGTWSYTGTTLTIIGPDGSSSTSVAEGASSFTTPMRPFFSNALDNMISSLTEAAIAEIEDECGSVDAYLDSFTLTWNR